MLSLLNCPMIYHGREVLQFVELAKGGAKEWDSPSYGFSYSSFGSNIKEPGALRCLLRGQGLLGSSGPPSAPWFCDFRFETLYLKW